jgi:hypothetical protein
MDEDRSSGMSEPMLSGRNGHDPSRPSPTTTPRTAAGLGRRQVPYIVGIAGAVAVIIGSLMSWDMIVIGKASFSGESGFRGGTSTWVLLLGVLLMVRNIALLRGASSSSPSVRVGPLVTSGVMLFMVIRYAMSIRDSFTTWLMGTGAAQIAREDGVSQSTVVATFREWLNAGLLRITLTPGFWLVVGGAVVAAGAASAGLYMNRTRTPSISMGIV